jgi:hypothetical protein
MVITEEYLEGGGRSVLEFVGPEQALQASRQDIHRRIRRWLVNQHSVQWQGLGDT